MPPIVMNGPSRVQAYAHAWLITAIVIIIVGGFVVTYSTIAQDITGQLQDVVKECRIKNNFHDPIVDETHDSDSSASLQYPDTDWITGIPLKRMEQKNEYAESKNWIPELMEQSKCEFVKFQKLYEIATNHVFFLIILLTLWTMGCICLTTTIHVVMNTWKLISHEPPHTPASLKMRWLHSFLQSTLYSPLDIICHRNTNRRLADVITGYDMIHA